MSRLPLSRRREGLSGEARRLLEEALRLAGDPPKHPKELIRTLSPLYEAGLLEAQTLARLYFATASALAQEALQLAEENEEEGARRLAEARLYWRAAWGLLSDPWPSLHGARPEPPAPPA